jgi:hypothetical protein
VSKIDITIELRVHIARHYKTQKAAAAAWGVSTAFVSAVLTGRKRPTDAMLAEAGFSRVVEYVRVQP